MIHAALVASLIAGGLGPRANPRDTVTPTALAATGAGTLVSGSNAQQGGATAADAGESSDYEPAAWDRPDAATAVTPEQAVVGPQALPSGFARAGSVEGGAVAAVTTDTVRPRSTRPRAIEYSDWYYRRLTMHRIASFAEYPLFAGEYILGERLLHDERHGFPPSGLQTAHSAVAGGLAVVFGFNTITGGWNLWASRHDPAGRPRRLIHSLLMLAADAGFAATGASGGGAKHNVSNAQLHRSLAEASMGVALAGTLMVWVWRN